MNAAPYRAVFLSDVHLGTPAARAEDLAAFLETLSTERLFLLGDMVDGLRMRQWVHWPTTHHRVVEAIIGLAARGAEVIYIPGNHDAALRRYVGHRLAGVWLMAEHVHVTARGRRYWLVHGDRFDPFVCGGPVRRYVADLGYSAALGADALGRWMSRRAGVRPRSLVRYLKTHQPQARALIERFETTAALAAAKAGYDGIICGHIHHPSLRAIAGVHYANDGDWVESRTVLVEDREGTLSLLHPGEGADAVPA